MRRGRPYAEDPRENIVKVYLNDEEYEFLDSFCRAIKTSKSYILREAFFTIMVELNEREKVKNNDQGN